MDKDIKDSIIESFAGNLIRLGNECRDFDAENKRLKAEVQRLEEIVGSDAIDRKYGMCCDASDEVARLKAEVERLRFAEDLLKDENQHLHKDKEQPLPDGWNSAVAKACDLLAEKEKEIARLKAECQARQAENSVLAVECDSLKAEVERLTSDIQMEKENEDRLVREWQKANNEVYGLNTQVAALIDDQTRLKAEVERLKADLNKMTKTPEGVYYVDVDVGFWSRLGDKLPSSYKTFWYNENEKEVQS